MEAFAHLASTDALTGLPNRRSMEQKLNSGFKTAMDNNQHFCFGLLDVDYFKQVNDKFSHDVGDLALKRIADVMQRVMGELHNGRLYILKVVIDLICEKAFSRQKARCFQSAWQWS